MKIYIFIIFIFLFHCSLSQTSVEYEAFEYLNNVRQNPAQYTDSIGIDLSSIKPSHPLIWNDTLARVALKKAKDMAKRNYFRHVDPDGNGINILIHRAGYTLPKEWINPPSNNYFESIHWQETDFKTHPINGIKSLIYDKGVKKHLKAGHRCHLLAVTKWHRYLNDIGIAWYKHNKQYFLCVIIAKHNYHPDEF